MSGSLESSGSYDASPDEALLAVVEYDGPLLLDFDETLYLRNSTEDFLDTASPGLVALLILRVLDVLKPWRWFGGQDCRDVWRVRTIVVLMPWIWPLWRRRCVMLAREHGNRPLMTAVRSRTAETIITTLGFTRVVKPLIDALGMGDLRLVSARLETFADRQAGKAIMVDTALGPDVVSKSVVLTDSLDDRALLARCAKPLLTTWPGARYRQALGRVYMPGQYLTRVKRPGQRYILRGILQEDFAFWVICSWSMAPHHVTHVLGLLCLLLSFWAIYERGYVDNDWVAANYEKDPKLSHTFWNIDIATPVIEPWIWASVAGLAGIYLLNEPGIVPPLDAAYWAAVLVGTHFGFKLYNRIDKSSRIWLFPGLQFARTASFVVVVPVTLTASIALGAHVVARWVPYYLYRIGGKDWPEAPFFLSRLLFFVLLWLMIALTHDIHALFNWTALALLFWNVFRAHKELRAMIRGIHRIDRPGPSART